MDKFLLFIALFLWSKATFSQNQAPADQNPNSRTLYFVETSRPLEEIQSVYPYDIALRTAKGDTLNSANVFAQNGKPTVLMFWLTTCVPCRHELTAISGKYESWQAETGFNLYAISIDFPKNYGNFVKRVEDSRWPFPAYHDLNREFSVILPGQLNGLPQTFILDKTGRIVHHKRKFSPGDEDVLYDLIKEVAKQ